MIDEGGTREGGWTWSETLRALQQLGPFRLTDRRLPEHEYFWHRGILSTAHIRL